MFSKKNFIWVSSGQNDISPLLASLQERFWLPLENPLLAPHWKNSFRCPCPWLPWLCAFSLLRAIKQSCRDIFASHLFHYNIQLFLLRLILLFHHKCLISNVKTNQIRCCLDPKSFAIIRIRS